MRSVKNLSIVSAAGVALAMAVLGPWYVVNSVQGWSHGVRDWVEAEKSDAQLAAELEVMLEGMDQQILNHADALVEVEAKLESNTEHAQKLENRLSQQSDILERAKRLLDSDDGHFVIGDRTYDRNEVNADARGRLATCKQVRLEFDLASQMTARLQEAVDVGRAILADAKAARQTKAAELESLKVRLANARMLEQVNELAGELRQSPLGPNTELANKLAGFNQRVREAEARANSDHAPASGVVAWETSQPKSSVSDEIAEFLGQKESRQVAAH